MLTRAETAEAQLSLFGGFTLDVAGTRVVLPGHARRVLAYLVLMPSRTNDIDRHLLAERLWRDSPCERSAKSLRTALWRIRREAPWLVCTDRERVSLGPEVAVDVHNFQCRVARLLSTDDDPAPEDIQSLIGAVDLLPGWDEDWLTLAREQVRHKWMSALECAARRLSEQGRHSQATELLLMLVAAEPLRETAHAMLIDTYLRQGNLGEASLHLLTFARVLWAELEVQPSPALLGKLGMSPHRLTHMLAV